ARYVNPTCRNCGPGHSRRHRARTTHVRDPPLKSCRFHHTSGTRDSNNVCFAGGTSMNIAIREPWGLLNRLSRDRDGMLGAPPAEVAYSPPVDVHEEKDRYVVKADLPGVDPDGIEVTAEKGILTLRGERKAEKREQTEGYERVERVMGSFTRRFALP